MTRDHGYAIGALRSGFGIDRLPHAIGWHDDGDAWILELEGDRQLVLSKAEYTKVGRVEYREPVVFGLTGGGWHFVADDQYARFKESIEDDAPAARGKGNKPRTVRRTVQ